MKKKEKEILEEIRSGLKPPTDEEVNKTTAKWLFGKYAEKMLKYAPWSFVLLKMMWKEGEKPWED